MKLFGIDLSVVVLIIGELAAVGLLIYHGPPWKASSDPRPLRWLLRKLKP